MSEVTRAELRRLAEQATPGPWKAAWRYGLCYVDRIMSASLQPQPRRDHEGFLSGIKHEPEVVFTAPDADAAYIAAANPATMLALLDAEDERTRLAAQIERVRALHRPINVEPSDTVCEVCSYRLPNGRFLPTIEYPCPTIQALDGGE